MEQVMAKLIEERQKHGLNASECLGNGLEAGPRRCVPKTALREAVGGLGGIWCRWPKNWNWMEEFTWKYMGCTWYTSIYMIHHGTFWNCMELGLILCGGDWRAFFCWFWYDRRDVLECKVQILGMAVVTLIFALLGFLSPAHRQCVTWDVWCFQEWYIFWSWLTTGLLSILLVVVRGGLLQSMMMLFTFMGVLTSIFAENNSPTAEIIRSTRGLRRLRFCSMA